MRPACKTQAGHFFSPLFVAGSVFFTIFENTLIQLNAKLMKKIFMLCLAGALALASTACDDKDDKGGGIPVR